MNENIHRIYSTNININIKIIIIPYASNNPYSNITCLSLHLRESRGHFDVNIFLLLLLDGGNSFKINLF